VPEGDTIWRVADRLRPALVGAELRRFDAPRLTGPRPRLGERVVAVEAVGKHLLVRFERGVTVQTHLRMTGSWHLYRPNERWRKPAHLARLVIGVDGWLAVCFAAPVVRSVGPGEDPVAHLGPDLASERADLDVAVARMATLVDADALIVDALLDQRVAAGVGNVYKSEVLWAARVSPLARVAAVDEAKRRELLAAAHRFLRANLGPGQRVTAPGVPGGVAVYGRRGRPCPRCGTPIVRRVLGRTVRSTYWCPRCQPAPEAAAAEAGTDR
jgi:endonuclease-8